MWREAPAEKLLGKLAALEATIARLEGDDEWVAQDVIRRLRLLQGEILIALNSAEG